MSLGLCFCPIKYDQKWVSYLRVECYHYCGQSSKTVENLSENGKLSLAILNSKTKEGYQILGEIERIDRGAILDGYGPDNEEKWAGYPQAEHQLLIRVQKVASLTSGPHSDEFI